MSIKRWKSKVGGIALEGMLQRDLNANQRSDGYNAELAPKCHRCSLMTGKRIHVDGYHVANFGKRDGEPFVEFKANHHGEESVIRCIGWSWPPRDGERFKYVMAGLPFFTDQAEATIHVPSWWPR
jgi:hypothetical protein